MALSEFRIIADDLTGALDAAAPLAQRVGAFTVSWGRDDGPRTPRSGCDIGTREADEATACARSADVAQRWWQGFAGVAFKKVDSMWRGHAATEIAAAIAAGDFDRAVIAPAFPAHGRVTRGGYQLKVCAQTTVAIADLVAELRAAGLPAERESNRHPNARVQVCDADDQPMLQGVVARHARANAHVLWCGTGGLAAALGAHYARGGHAVPTKSIAAGPGPILVVVGSDHVVAQAQADALASVRGVAQLRINLRTMAELGAEELDTAGADTILVRFAVPPAMSRNEAGDRARRALAGLVPRLPRPGFAIATGGETLRALCDALEATALVVDGEATPGFPLSTWTDGRWSGASILSKSGSFGTPDYFVEFVSGIVRTAAGGPRRMCAI